MLLFLIKLDHQREHGADHSQKPHGIWSGLTVFPARIDSRGMDSATREIHDYVSKVKVQPEVKQAYMRLEEIIYYERKDAAREAVRTTMVQGILVLLEKHGDVPDTVRKRLEEEKNTDILNRWFKLAANVDNMDGFEARMGQE